MKKFLQSLIALSIVLCVSANAFSQSCQLYASSVRMVTGQPSDDSTATVFVGDPSNEDYTVFELHRYRVSFWKDAAKTIPVTEPVLKVNFKGHWAGPLSMVTDGNGPTFNVSISNPLVMSPLGSAAEYITLVPGTNYYDGLLCESYVSYDGGLPDFYRGVISVQLGAECVEDFAFQSLTKTICVNTTLDLRALFNGPASAAFFGVGVSGDNFSSASAGNYNVTATSTINGQVYNSTITITTVPVTKTVTASTLSVCYPSSITICAAPGAVSYGWTDGVNSFPTSSDSCLTLSTPGTATLYAVINNGFCTFLSDAVTVSVNPLPVKTITATYAADNLSVTFCSDQSAASSYQWYKDGVLIAAATNKCLTTNQNGTYYCEIVSDKGCSTASDSVIFESLLSIQDLNLRGTVSANLANIELSVSADEAVAVQIDIEKSIDGRNFVSTYTATKSVAASNNNFSFNFPISGTVYFRAKMTQKMSGKVMYSNTIILTNKGLKDAAFSIVENPTKSNATIAYNLDKKGEFNVTVFSTSSQKISSSKVQLQGNGKLVVELPSNAGVYIINISSQATKSNLKIIKN